MTDSTITPITSTAAAGQTPPAPAAPVQDVPRLWTVKDAAGFLCLSERKIAYMLKTPATEPGSVPFVRLGRSPQFIPADLTAWAAAGFPPAGTFKAWQDAENRPRKRAVCQPPFPG